MAGEVSSLKVGGAKCQAVNFNWDRMLFRLSQDSCYSWRTSQHPNNFDTKSPDPRSPCNSKHWPASGSFPGYSKTTNSFRFALRREWSPDLTRLQGRVIHIATSLPRLEIILHVLRLLYTSMKSSDHVSSSCADRWCWHHWSSPCASPQAPLDSLHSLRKRSKFLSSGSRMGTYHSLGIAELARSLAAAHHRQTTRDLC